MEDVVRGEHLRETTVVCDCGCDDADVSSSLGNVLFLHHVAYALFSEGEESHKGRIAMIRTDSQKHERQREEEEQGTKPNRFTDRADAMRRKGGPRCQSRSGVIVTGQGPKGARVKKNSQEQECDDHPGEEVNSDGILFHFGISAVGIADTRVGDEQGRKREPECAVGRKRYEEKINQIVSARRST